MNAQRRILPKIIGLLILLAVVGGGIASLGGLTSQDCFNNAEDCLVRSGIEPSIASFATITLGVVLVATFPLLITILLIWVERKIAARIQDRVGPNRVGPFGLIQPIADVLKLLGKEAITPVGADKLIYNLAPPFMVASVLLIWAVVPFTPYHYGADLEIGALYFVAVASIGTLAVMMAGWSSNNKYALLGSFRVVAQLISYEIPLALSLLVPVMLAGTMSMVGIVEAQQGMWYVFMVPLSAFLFFISSQAETGRAPFDLLEAESELIAGFNIEYSGMKFAMFFAGEFMHVFTNGVLMSVLFTGGWSGPFVYQAPLLGLVYLLGKASVWYFLSLLIRNTLPRLRIDQMMNFNWKFLVPLSVVNLLVVALLLRIIQDSGLAPSPELATDFVANIPQTAILLVANIIMTVAALASLRNQGRAIRRAAQAGKGSAALPAVGD